jgi:hypothetical protein
MYSIPQWPSVPGLVNEEVEVSNEDLGDPITALLDTKIRCVEFCGPRDARLMVIDAPRAHAVVLPGSFNPLHEGHMYDSDNPVAATCFCFVWTISYLIVGFMLSIFYAG